MNMRYMLNASTVIHACAERRKKCENAPMATQALFQLTRFKKKKVIYKPRRARQRFSKIICGFLMSTLLDIKTNMTFLFIEAIQGRR